MTELNLIHKNELDKLLVALVKTLDITKTQFDNLAKSYGAVGRFLEADPVFEPYHPVISPQGSLRLGTIIQPINEGDDLDVDLVFRLLGKSTLWTQHDIKNLVGARLKSHATYADMLDKEEGRRCWTLLYRQESDNEKERYHMDILPCVADKEYNNQLKRILWTDYTLDNIKQIAIRITDKESSDYTISVDINSWLKSNPDGYAIWFASRCKNTTEIRESMMNTIMPIGQYTEDKTILQRIVQLLKRHRDIMFGYDEDKPISIIITTLAGQSYNGETCLIDGLCNVIDKMEQNIYIDGEGHYVVRNPVNSEENFADKWEKYPKRKDNFFAWLNAVKQLKANLIDLKGMQLRESLSNTFGKNPVSKAFEKMAINHKDDATAGKMKIASTGLLGSIGKTLNANNTFYGKE